MKLKIIIVGKNSFIARNLYKYLKNRCKVEILSFREFLKKNIYNNIDYVINCSSTLNYINQKYKIKFDNDFLISKKILNYQKCKLVLLSSRKVYKPKNNIKENGKILLKENYSKNKFFTEKKIIEILNDRVLVLRISNIIGFDSNKKGRKLHKTFIDFFIENIKKNIIFDNKGVYKDFLPINLFSRIVFLLIKKNKSGIFNVSIGKKVYLTKIIKWLNHYNPNKKSIKIMTKIPYKTINRECFFLNNTKLLRVINIKINLNDLKNECLGISKKLFYEK